MKEITEKWETIAVVGYQGSVARWAVPLAHGGVCLLQAKRNRKGELLGRKVNTNGRYREEGEPFPLFDELLANWRQLGEKKNQ